jgi:hypothetical protein
LPNPAKVFRVTLLPDLISIGTDPLSIMWN